MKQPTKEQLNDPKWWAMNAPEGATHVDKHGTFYKLVVHKMFSYTNVICQLSAWVQTKPIPLHELIERPEPMKEWHGMQDGMPPVGTECEYAFKRHTEADYCEWDRCTIQYISDYGIVIKEVWGAEAFFSHEHYDLQFRPILSERDKAIDEIVDDCNGMIDSDQAAWVFDQGYRKQMSQAEANDVLMNRPFYVPAPERRALLDKLGFKE